MACAWTAVGSVIPILPRPARVGALSPSASNESVKLGLHGSLSWVGFADLTITPLDGAQGTLETHARSELTAYGRTIPRIQLWQTWRTRVASVRAPIIGVVPCQSARDPTSRGPAELSHPWACELSRQRLTRCRPASRLPWIWAARWTRRRSSAGSSNVPSARWVRSGRAWSL